MKWVVTFYFILFKISHINKNKHYHGRKSNLYNDETTEII